MSEDISVVEGYKSVVTDIAFQLVSSKTGERTGVVVVKSDEIFGMLEKQPNKVDTLVSVVSFDIKSDFDHFYCLTPLCSVEKFMQYFDQLRYNYFFKQVKE